MINKIVNEALGKPRLFFLTDLKVHSWTIIGNKVFLYWKGTCCAKKTCDSGFQLDYPKLDELLLKRYYKYF